MCECCASSCTFVCCPLSLCALKHSHTHATADQNLWMVCAIAGSRLSIQGGDTPSHAQLWWAGRALEMPLKCGCKRVQDGSHIGANSTLTWCECGQVLVPGSFEQCSCYPGGLGHFHRDVSGGDMETQILPFSTNAHSRASWLEVGARLQSPKLFLQWGICAESSKKHLGRNELPAKYRLFHFEGCHPIYVTPQSFSNF